MTNIDIAQELRKRGWSTTILVCGSLSATCGNIKITRKKNNIRVTIHQKRTIKADYIESSQPKEVLKFIEWLFSEIAGLISFSLESGRKNEKHHARY